MKLRKIQGAFPTLMTIASALTVGLLLQPVVAAANISAVAGETVEGVTKTAAGTGKAIPTKPTTVTLEQIRAAMAEAQKVRQALLQPDPVIADPAIQNELREKWGVEVYGVRKSAKGYMMDFRFRVVDADKALPLFDPRIKPYVLTERSNIKLPVPIGEKVGAFRTTNRGKNIQVDKDYYMMFANPDSHVKQGQKVSIVIGDFRVERLTLR